MSSTYAQTQYTFAINPSDSSLFSGIAFSVTKSSTFGDPDAFALLAAVKAALPAGLVFNAEVAKADTGSTSYTTNAGATPPSFT